jgi:uncharacterized repeat protein (TIGR03803 family)
MIDQKQLFHLASARISRAVFGVSLKIERRRAVGKSQVAVASVRLPARRRDARVEAAGHVCSLGIIKSSLVLLALALFPLADAQTLEILHRWTEPDAGSWAPLVQGADGNFYGTTYRDGDSLVDSGGIFKMTPDGEVSTIFQFPNERETSPGLILASDGNFYGIAVGAALGPDRVSYNGFYSTVFRMTPNGEVSTVWEKTSVAGDVPRGRLVEGKDGNLYGVTSGNYGEAGTQLYGSIYRITPAGLKITLASFNKSNGAYPQEALVLGKDGNFYGVTYRGGAHDFGTIFSVTPDKVLTKLYSFTEYAVPNALVQGDDGNLYGTTRIGGFRDAKKDDGYGTIFRISPDGVFTNLFLFHGTNGAEPWAGLVKGGDGNFYGTTWMGGSAGLNEFTSGTVFRITPNGVFSTLMNFDGVTAYRPGSVLAQGRDRKLYGTGGTNRDGYAFRVTILPATLPALNIVRSGDSVVLSWSVTAADATLEMANSLPAQTWSTVQTTPIQIGDQEVVTHDLTSENQIFRLRK